MKKVFFNTEGMTDTQIAIMYISMGMDIASLIGAYAATKKILKNLVGNPSTLQNFGISSMSVFIAAKTAGSMPLTSLTSGILKEVNVI